MTLTYVPSIKKPLYSTENYNDHKEAMDRLFSTYITPQIKEIYHPEIIQEWRLNIDAAEYEKI